MTSSVRALLGTMVSAESLLPEGEAEAWRTAPGERGVPKAILAPAHEEELASVLDRAGREGWRVMPAGRGTWLEGGGPSEVELVVSTRRMIAVRDYEPGDLTFTAEAGVSLRALQGITEAHRQWLPLNPPGGVDGSLGATAATGAWGSLRTLYGMPRDQVLGVTMISGAGEFLRWGGRVVKNVAGFDVTRLCVGSWGALGVITGVSARLYPMPERETTLVYRGPGVEALLPAARAAAVSPLPLAGVELLDPLPGTMVEPGGRRDPRAGAGLILRILGSRSEVEETVARIRAELGPSWGEPSVADRSESRRLHQELAEWEKDAALVARLSLVPSLLGTLAEEVEELRSLAAHGTPAALVEVAADVPSGVLRAAVRPVEKEWAGAVGWGAALSALRARLEERGGSLTLSHGPAPLMREVGPWHPSEGERKLMVGLKSAFDPEGILAPGRLGL